MLGGFLVALEVCEFLKTKRIVVDTYVMWTRLLSETVITVCKGVAQRRGEVMHIIGFEAVQVRITSQSGLPSAERVTQ